AAAPARGRPAAAARRASARARSSLAAWAGLLLPVFPFARLALCVVLRATVAFLDLADKLIALARHLVELIVGQLAPALLERALHLLPIALDAVPIHRSLRWLNGRCAGVAKRVPRAARGLDLRRLYQARDRREQRRRLDRLRQLRVVARRERALRGGTRAQQHIAVEPGQYRGEQPVLGMARLFGRLPQAPLALERRRGGLRGALVAVDVGADGQIAGEASVAAARHGALEHPAVHPVRAAHAVLDLIG